MADALILDETVRVPAEAIRMKAVRSGGPGGQNVNKVASKVELRIDLGRIEGLDEGAMLRLKARIRNQMDAEGNWIVVSDRTRDQLKNLEDAREKVLKLLAECRVAPRPRRATRPTRGSQERRLAQKRSASDRKRDRRGGGWE